MGASMKPDTVRTLLELNREFYQKFAPAFAATRRRIQPGVRKILAGLPHGKRWLDLGCGSGAVAKAFCDSPASQGALYIGLDFSTDLLAEARRALERLDCQHCTIDFRVVDLAAADWAQAFPAGSFDGIFAFAVLHHLPGEALRREVLCRVHSLLRPQAKLIFSVWQLQHSRRLLSRRLPWQTIGIHDCDVDAGDTLIDWRFSLPCQAGETGLRYVHLFNRQELADLALRNGFEIVQTFESDGEGGRLGLYQIWRAI